MISKLIIFVLFLERFVIIIFLASGGMAELADALDLESSGETRAGSIPVASTKKRDKV